MVARLTYGILALFFSGLLEARTWVVAEDGSGDFLEIYQAVDAAADGDVILVRPGLYVDFKVESKSVSIIGSGPSAIVATDNIHDNNSISVFGLDRTQRVVLAHLSLQAPRPLSIGRNASVESGGSTVASDLQFVLTPKEVDGHLAKLVSAFGIGEAYAFVGRCRMDTSQIVHLDLPPAGSPQGGGISAAICVITQGHFFGHPGGPAGSFDGYPGGAGIAAWESEVYLAELLLHGAEGGMGWAGGIYCDQTKPPGKGGSGLRLEGRIGNPCTALVAGRRGLVGFHGGPGGLGGPLPDCDNPTIEGGPGGDGIECDPHSMAIVAADFQISHGKGGYGDPNGPPGSNTTGNVIFTRDLLPTLTLEGEGGLGQPVTLHLQSKAGRQVYLVVSDRFRRLFIPGVSGFPLFAVPEGDIFRFVDIGHTSADDIAIDVTVPDEEALLGKAFMLQALVMPDRPGEAPTLTNVVALVPKP